MRRDYEKSLFSYGSSRSCHHKSSSESRDCKKCSESSSESHHHRSSSKSSRHRSSSSESRHHRSSSKSYRRSSSSDSEEKVCKSCNKCEKKCREKKCNSCNKCKKRCGCDTRFVTCYRKGCCWAKIELNKIAEPTTYSAEGNVIKFTYSIVNLGDLSLTGNLTLCDTLLGKIDLGNVILQDNIPYEFVYNYTITAQNANQAILPTNSYVFIKLFCKNLGLVSNEVRIVLTRV